MGFYIRKAFTFGPIRLNLSRSGLGTSFGVKGARIGVGPKGTYVHMGRHGLYYKQYLNSRSTTSSNADSYNLQNIQSADVSQLVDVSSKDLIAELNRVKSYVEIFPILLTIFIIFSFIAINSQVPFWPYGLLFILAILALVYARHRDVTYGTAILNYQFEAEIGSKFNSIKDAFEKNIIACSKAGYVEAMAEIDAKYHSDAGTGGKLRANRPSLSLPPRVQSNIKAPTLSTNSQTIYFFPDVILIYAKSGVGSISYTDLKIEIKQQKFVATEGVPNDAKVVGSAWRYMNKKGGPDRRFKNNPEFPIVLYDFMKLASSNGFKHLFFFSRLEAGTIFAQSLTSLGADYSKVAELDV